jgi:hypothetical protein
MNLRATAIIVAVLLGSAELCGSLSCTEDLSPVFGQRGEFTLCVYHSQVLLFVSVCGALLWVPPPP